MEPCELYKDVRAVMPRPCRTTTGRAGGRAAFTPASQADGPHATPAHGLRHPACAHRRAAAHCRCPDAASTRWGHPEPGRTRARPSPRGRGLSWLRRRAQHPRPCAVICCGCRRSGRRSCPRRTCCASLACRLAPAADNGPSHGGMHVEVVASQAVCAPHADRIVSPLHGGRPCTVTTLAANHSARTPGAGAVAQPGEASEGAGRARRLVDKPGGPGS
jgi:hypothetical protein